MGNCLASPEYMQTLSSSGNLTSAVISQASRSTPLTNDTKSSKYQCSSSALSREEEGELPNGQVLATPIPREFTLQELKVATQRFNPDCLIGEGSFGKVYRGWLDSKQPSKSGSGLAVAIKKLNPESILGFEEWQSEVNLLGRLSHPNLVKLLGYCWEDGEVLLVYEFIHRGSLDNYLFGRGSALHPLPWTLRLKIAIGAARGLAFLHSSNCQVIYRDVKTANILLDVFYNAKLSDFGLAKLGPSANKSHVTTRVMGTYGYAAPEYIATGHLFLKSDVYGFGVVLLEILTGERAFDVKRPSGKRNLVNWSKPFLSDRKKLENIMDKRLEDKYPSKAAAATAELALKCLADAPKARPSMQEVLETLEKIEAMDDKPKATKRSLTDIVQSVPLAILNQNGIQLQQISLQDSR